MRKEKTRTAAIQRVECFEMFCHFIVFSSKNRRFVLEPIRFRWREGIFRRYRRKISSEPIRPERLLHVRSWKIFRPGDSKPPKVVVKSNIRELQHKQGAKRCSLKRCRRSWDGGLPSTSATLTSVCNFFGPLPNVGVQLVSNSRSGAYYDSDYEYGTSAVVSVNLDSNFDAVLVFQVHINKLQGTRTATLWSRRLGAQSSRGYSCDKRDFELLKQRQWHH